MNRRFLTAIGIAAALAAAPLSPAEARGWDHHHDRNSLLLPFVAVAGLVTGAALIATAPVRAVERTTYIEPQPYYPPPPPQVVYAAPPPPMVVYERPAPVYYVRPAPRYYPAPVAYYPPPRYYY